MLHPLRLLRKRFSKSPELRGFSTQSGLAKLVERSESYIRNVENGVVPFTAKLAEAVEQKTGVGAGWLLGLESRDPDTQILTPDGRVWEPIEAIQLIKTEINANKQALTQAISEAARGGIPIGDFFAEMVKQAVLSDLDKGSLDFVAELANVMRSHGHLAYPNVEGNKVAR